jgi:hypothetical protein
MARTLNVVASSPFSVDVLLHPVLFTLTVSSPAPPLARRAGPC